jgi:hypothetical protein
MPCCQLTVWTFNFFTTLKIYCWVVMLCSVVVGYQCFIGPCCLPLQGEMTGDRKKWAQHYTVSQPRRTQIFTAMKTSNITENTVRVCLNITRFYM